ncbi:zinc transporter ZIP3 isoform 1-T2 [Synchiropus picturatus]
MSRSEEQRTSMAVGGRVSSPIFATAVREVTQLQVDAVNVPALELKLGALAVLLSVTLLFGFAPLCIVRGVGQCSLSPETRHKLLGMVSCFAGGVFFATCLLDLLPDYLEGIAEAFDSAGITLQFPLPEFIVAMGFFLVLLMEQIVLAFKDQSSPPVEEHRALLVDSSVQAGDQSDRPPSHHHHHHHHRGRRGSDDSDDGHFHVDFRSQSALRAFILVFSLSLHSVFEGLAVGLLEQPKEVLEICLALMIHKSIIAFSMSFKLIQGHLRRSAVVGCLLLFAAMSPVGIGMGVALTETKSSPQHKLARCSLEGLAAGTFIYITFMEILPHELKSGRNRIPKVAMLLLGFALVTGVLFIKL